MATFMRGAKPTPRHKLAGATPHRPRGATPPQVIVVPQFLEMWLNDTYGNCVSAEEAFAKAAYAVMSGQPEMKITDTTLKAFCDKYDLLNGANLPPVMDDMINDGFHQDGTTYKDGPYTAVDYSNEALLQNAIAQGPVKIGIDANALPSGAGNANGWYAFGGSPGQFNNEDHCTSLCGYGPAAALFAALGVAVPANAPTGTLYLHYTWSTIGVVDHAWIMSTVGEAWVRNPTTPGVGPIPPNPPVCPPGQHIDPTTGQCVPDGPPQQNLVATTQTYTFTVPGFFGQPHSVTIPGQVAPVTQVASKEALPPWVLQMILADLRLLCTEAANLPAPWNTWASIACGLIPPAQVTAEHRALFHAGITIPPWLLPLLRTLCQFAALLPPPYSTYVSIACGLIPPAIMAAIQKPCGCQ